MKKYYIDNRNGRLITKKEIKRDNLKPAPVGYYEYRNSGMEGLYIETWYCGGGQYLDYAYSKEALNYSNIPFYQQRNKHFENHGVKPIEISAYAAPPSEYESNIKHYEKYNKKGNEKE